MSSSTILVYTIYCHTHTDSGRRYIGLTKMTMLKRWNRHVYDAKRKTGKGCYYFWAAIRKYGKDAFSHEVLETVHTDLDQANLAEEWWIRKLDAKNPEKGFNLARGGRYVSLPTNADHSKRLSDAAKARWQDPDTRARYMKAVAEVHSRPEFRQKITAASKAAFAKPEVKERHAAALVGRTLSPEHCARISADLRDRAADPEDRQRRSEMSKELWDRPGFRKNQSEKHAGKTCSEEMKAKLRAANKSSNPEVRARIAASVKAYWAKKREGACV